MGMKTRAWAAGGLLLIAPAFAAGCSSDTDDRTTAPATTTAEAPATSSPVPTTDGQGDDAETTTAQPELSAAEQDEADVKETLQRYNRALDDAFNGDASVEAIYPFSRDTAREQWVTQVMASQAQGTSSTGLTELQMIEIDVDGDTAEVTACADVSDVEVVDETGDSVVAEDRLDRSLQEFVLERDGSAEVGWYVVEDTNRNEPCDR
jgi:hypothetical protein